LNRGLRDLALSMRQQVKSQWLVLLLR